MSVNKVNSDGSLQRIAGGILYADAPIGTINPFGGSNVPSGYLLCNGQAVSRTTYADLFAVIGTVFGSGDGSTTFNVPDLREATTKGVGLNGKSAVHYDNDGIALGEFIEDRVQDHLHRTKLLNMNFQIGGENVAPVTENGNSGIGTVGDIVVGRHGATNEVKAVGVNYIIKAKQVAVPFDVAEYIRNQNVLSDEETTSFDTEARMNYDGVVYASWSLNTGVVANFKLNGVTYTQGTVSTGYISCTIPFKKGDTLQIKNATTTKVAYYKLRDYTGR